MSPSTLLVEDNEALADSLIAAFEDEGVPVDHARTWDQGLELFRVRGHELVIADYNLPGSDHGLMLLLQVKQRLPSSQLVLISGALSPQAERELEPLGIIDHYFRKDSTLANKLLPWVHRAVQRATEETDWKEFAEKHLSDPESQREQVARIDALLRADVDRRA